AGELRLALAADRQGEEPPALPLALGPRGGGRRPLGAVALLGAEGQDDESLAAELADRVGLVLGADRPGDRLSLSLLGLVSELRHVRYPRSPARPDSGGPPSLVVQSPTVARRTSSRLVRPRITLKMPHRRSGIMPRSSAVLRMSSTEPPSTITRRTGSS